ncbi:hypothetical protein APA_676 [Pseudanabaena sp. lw0831]|nr:hypothetical protein APA_676 [Pseudanabaena sp. lw0831]
MPTSQKSQHRNTNNLIHRQNPRIYIKTRSGTTDSIKPYSEK